MVRSLRSVFVITIVLGMVVLTPLSALADPAPFKLSGIPVTSETRSVVQFNFDRMLMPRVRVDARIGSHGHLRFDFHAQNISTKYEVTSITMSATFQYPFTDRAELRIDIGPHPALTANERLAVEYIVHV
jgi:hypothetical protein